MRPVSSGLKRGFANSKKNFVSNLRSADFSLSQLKGSESQHQNQVVSNKVNFTVRTSSIRQAGTSVTGNRDRSTSKSAGNNSAELFSPRTLSKLTAAARDFSSSRPDEFQSFLKHLTEKFNLKSPDKNLIKRVERLFRVFNDKGSLHEIFGLSNPERSNPENFEELLSGCERQIRELYLQSTGDISGELQIADYKNSDDVTDPGNKVFMCVNGKVVAELAMQKKAEVIVLKSDFFDDYSIEVKFGLLQQMIEHYKQQFLNKVDQNLLIRIQISKEEIALLTEKKASIEKLPNTEELRSKIALIARMIEDAERNVGILIEDIVSFTSHDLVASQGDKREVESKQLKNDEVVDLSSPSRSERLRIIHKKNPSEPGANITGTIDEEEVAAIFVTQNGLKFTSYDNFTADDADSKYLRIQLIAGMFQSYFDKAAENRWNIGDIKVAVSQSDKDFIIYALQIALLEMQMEEQYAEDQSDKNFFGDMQQQTAAVMSIINMLRQNSEGLYEVPLPIIQGAFGIDDSEAQYQLVTMAFSDVGVTSGKGGQVTNSKSSSSSLSSFSSKKPDGRRGFSSSSAAPDPSQGLGYHLYQACPWYQVLEGESPAIKSYNEIASQLAKQVLTLLSDGYHGDSRITTDDYGKYFISGRAEIITFYYKACLDALKNFITNPDNIPACNQTLSDGTKIYIIKSNEPNALGDTVIATNVKGEVIGTSFVANVPEKDQPEKTKHLHLSVLSTNPDNDLVKCEMLKAYFGRNFSSEEQKKVFGETKVTMSCVGGYENFMRGVLGPSRQSGESAKLYVADFVPMIDIHRGKLSNGPSALMEPVEFTNPAGQNPNTQTPTTPPL